MKKRQIPPATASKGERPLPSNPTPTPQEIPTTPLNSSLQLGNGKRSLAWHVAPNLIVSFKYAWAGLSYAFKTQRNFRIHVFIGIVAVGMGIFLRVTRVEMAALALTSGAVLSMELLNTAIESVVDLLVQQNYHELAKIAKDCAAGAVLVSAFVALMVAVFILLPPLLALIQQMAIAP
ncbi:MAG: diacylglycerol kinase family protein [Oscillatoriaceae bacterium SKW80]|nr:diacylglycerol kinase family protein [Oscillatoriaceae bacterium SKYG93]MCX8119289.1 diacylglycerol kinase family protein [Oscillatoriaceae bacterium SKW80]MDW8454756.1 diacylglycerol kinase family protein [Oscillatoriaceae cyanobacterium SKYGB_i_bin93]HIK28463.1 diacylglycerol kinase family protein [Oscillatoriaceae cyanobacterium M7585_C2015_266]